MLFVCLGNICRSPAAEAVFHHRIRAFGLDGVVDADSAGTGSWHVCEGAHELSIAVGRERGYSFDHVVRHVGPEDFAVFYLIVPMDRSNLDVLRSSAP